MNKNTTFETAMNQLNEIVLKLESGEVSLDESLKLFEKGTELASFCYDKLNKAEQKITQMTALEQDKPESEDDHESVN